MTLYTVRERQAFCHVYKSLCAYSCGDTVTPYNLELDHIIPQSTNKTELTRLRQLLSLGEEFDLYGYENILPCCSKCNKKKGKSIRTRILSLLDEAQKNKPFVVKKVKQLNAQFELDKYCETTINFELHFRNTIRKGPINKGKISELLNLPIKHLNDQEFLIMSHNDNEQFRKIKVSNVQEYRDARSQGYYAHTTYDMKTEVHYNAINTILYFLEIAKNPKICYFSNSGFILSNTTEICSSILDFNYSSSLAEEFIISHIPLKELIATNQVRIIDRQNHDILHFETNCNGYVIREILRGDFNGKGYEQILCNVYMYAVGGTFGSGTMIILNKESAYTLAKPEAFNF